MVRSINPFFAGAVVALLLAVWLAWPGRNVHGNPSLERLLAECNTTSGITMRLYEGNGGATMDFWYSVTAAAGIARPERQIFFAYSAPILRSLACDAQIVHIASDSLTVKLSESTINELRSAPRTYWRGAEQEMATQPLTYARYALAVLLAVSAIAFYVLSRRKTVQMKGAA